VAVWRFAKVNLKTFHQTLGGRAMRCKELLGAATLTVVFCFVAPLCCWAAGEASTAIASGPKITDVVIRQLPHTPTPKFRLSILGENLGNNTTTTTVRLDTKDPAQPVEYQVASVTPTEVEVEVWAPIGAVINRIRVFVEKLPCERKGLTISLKPSPP